MKEIHLNLDEEQVFAAERKRTQGLVKEAANSVRPAIDFPISRFNDLTDEKKKIQMMASRIFVVATTSMANRSLKASSVVNHLSQARRVIVDIYRDVNVQNAAHTIKEDTRGNPYEFNTEMARDEVEYTLILAALTGNTSLLNDAIAKMDGIIRQAQDADAKGVAQFQRERIKHRMGPTKETFAKLKKSAKESIDSAGAIGRWERVSTVASRYSIEALKCGNIIEAAKGIKASVKAAVSDRSTVTILPRQAARELTENVRHWNWQRTTPKGTEYLDLKLP